MAQLPILTATDRRLRKISDPVEAFDDGVRRLMDDMLETMYAASGVGLAAPQVGRFRRVVVADVEPADGERGPVRMANPVILDRSEEMSVREEGCLSIPEQSAEVARPARVRIAYLDGNGQGREEAFEGVLATCLQHEIEHLDGILFVDHLSAVRRNMILRRLAKDERARARSRG